MARGGSGGHAGSSHSSGGFSSGRSSGGFSSGSSSHRSGSGSGGHRSGSSGSYGSSHSHGYSHRTVVHTEYYPPHRHYHTTTVYHTSRRTSLAAILSVALIIVVVALILAGPQICGQPSVPKSTVNRDRLDSGYGYVMDCVDDEAGELANARNVGNELQDFWKKTGVQPWIYVKAYDPANDPSRLSQDDREALANTYFDDNGLTEATFLTVFFENSYGDIYLDYTVYVVGKQADAVMDAEACTIYEAFVKELWYNDALTTDEVFAGAYTKTADRIMDKSTTGFDVAFVFGIGLVLVIVIIGAVVVMRIRRKHEKERSEETERILNTPISELDSDDDEVLHKYETENKSDSE